jgi:phosphoadenosine phosphosulfate reductase
MDEPKRAEPDSRWTPEKLEEIGRTFEEAPVEAVLAWGIETFSPGICLATSFGPQSIVLMHLISTIDPRTTVFYLDTELLFRETYELRDRLADTLGLEFTRVTSEFSVEEQAARYGQRLWTRQPDFCCHLRKVLPLRRFLSDKKAWITGVRNGHSAGRAHAGIVEWDSLNGIVKLNPLVRWDTQRIWDYLHANRLPFNRLHLEGYPSIGCQPCTRPVRPGEDPRSGRWAGFEKTECGIHGVSGPGTVVPLTNGRKETVG